LCPVLPLQRYTACSVGIIVGMTRFGTNVEEAVSHEAGHIVVGTAFNIEPRGMGVEIIQRADGAEPYVKQFATRAFQPPDDQISGLPDPVKKALIFFIAGGLAGQKYARKMESGDGLEADRITLAKYNPDKTLEELADMLQSTIHKHRRVFRRLSSLIKQRFEELMKNNPGTGFHMLLTEDDIKNAFDKDKVPRNYPDEPAGPAL
jgi:hypothetical protein